MNPTVAVSAAAAILSILVWPAARVPSPQASTFPKALQQYLNKQVNLTSDEHTRLLEGEAVTKLLPGDPAREVSVFGAVWIKASIPSYIAAVRDIEQLEKGRSFLVTKKISDPPRLEDFDQMTLPIEDVRDLKSCKVGDCELKLSETSLLRVRREIDWTRPIADVKPQVETLMRQLAFDYANGYLTGGNARLATYRDSERPTFVAEEFKTMVDGMTSLTSYLPALRTYLLAYPNAALPNSESFLYWQSARFGLKPTIRINHLVITEEPTHVAVATKMLYANHYFWTALELRVLVPDPARGTGFWFASISRSRSDGLSGFTGSLIRGKVRGEVQKGMDSALQATKRQLEKS